MRIAMVVRTFPKLSETFVAAEATALRDAGHEVEIFCWRHEQQRGQASYASALGALTAVAASWTIASDLIRRHSGRWRLKGFFVVLGLLRAVRKFRPDIIHAHFASSPTVVASALGRYLRVPTTATFHAADYRIGLTDSQLARRMSTVENVFCISEPARDHLVRLPTVEPGNVKVVRAGLARGLFELSPVSRPALSAGPATNIISIARLVPKKGHRALLYGIRELIDTGTENVCVDIIGVGPLARELDALVRSLRLDQHVHMRGAMDHSEALAQLSRADVAILPCVATPDGDADGIPVFLMESAVLGVPIVTTPIGGITDLIIDGVTGAIMEGTSPAAICRGLRRAMSEEAQAWTVNARRRVNEEFLPAIQVSRYEDAWRELSGRR